MRKSRGVTLIELVLVIALVLTLSTLATVNFIKSYQARDFRQFVSELASYLRFVQYKAIEDGLVLKVSIDSDSGRIESLAQGSKPKEFKSFTTPFSKRFESNNQFSVQLDKGRDIFFSPDGSMTINKITVSNERYRAKIEIRNRLGAFRIKYEE
jgi:prepilin-type N-terminal cleavage/methylation domain-containing protein